MSLLAVACDFLPVIDGEAMGALLDDMVVDGDSEATVEVPGLPCLGEPTVKPNRELADAHSEYDALLSCHQPLAVCPCHQPLAVSDTLPCVDGNADPYALLPPVDGETPSHQQICQDKRVRK